MLAEAACVQRGGYNGLQGCCSKGDDLVAALDAVRAEEDRLGAAESHRAGIFCSHRSAKTPNPDDPIPNFVRGRESTWLTFVLENPEVRRAFIFAMEQS